MFSYLKARLDPIVERVKSSPTTGYIKDKFSAANQKTRSFISQRVGGSSSLDSGRKYDNSEIAEQQQPQQQPR